MDVLRKLYEKVKFYYSINWTKTLYFNFKKFPFSTAKKLPFVFFGRVRFHDISGQIAINAPIESGMFGFGHDFEKPKRSKGIAEFNLSGKLILNGPMHMGKDVFFSVEENAVTEFGYMACLGSDVRFLCTDKISLGDWTGIGYQSQVIDTNSHPMKNSETGEQYPMSGPIHLGSHNAVSNRVSIMPNTTTPDFCVIASNSLCSKNYSSLGSNVLIGGVPAKLIKQNYTRDWDTEKPLLKKYKIIEMGLFR